MRLDAHHARRWHRLAGALGGLGKVGGGEGIITTLQQHPAETDAVNRAAYCSPGDVTGHRFYVGEHGSLPALGAVIEVCNSHDGKTSLAVVDTRNLATREYTLRQVGSRQPGTQIQLLLGMEVQP